MSLRRCYASVAGWRGVTAGGEGMADIVLRLRSLRLAAGKQQEQYAFSPGFSKGVTDRPDERPGGHDWRRPDFSLHADLHQKVGESPEVVQ